MSIEMDEAFLYAAIDFGRFEGATFQEPVAS